MAGAIPADAIRRRQYAQIRQAPEVGIIIGRSGWPRMNWEGYSAKLQDRKPAIKSILPVQSALVMWILLAENYDRHSYGLFFGAVNRFEAFFSHSQW
jgi:hypothetical protein